MEEWLLLPQSFYLKEDPFSIAEQVLGKILKSSIDGIITAGRIVEVEVYKAPEDKASHAYSNLRTKRTETMFLEGGIAYIYLCYGIHHMFNIVSGEEGFAHAILIRAVEPIYGLDEIKKRRKLKKPSYNLTNGPGKTGSALAIHTRQNGSCLYDANHPLTIWSDGFITEKKNIVRSARVGIDYAEEYISKPWRYYLKNNPWVSKPKQA